MPVYVNSSVHNLHKIIRHMVQETCILTFTDVEMNSRIRSRRCKMTVPIRTTSMVALICNLLFCKNRSSRIFNKILVSDLEHSAFKKISINPAVPTIWCLKGHFTCSLLSGQQEALCSNYCKMILVPVWTSTVLLYSNIQRINKIVEMLQTLKDTSIYLGKDAE